MQIFQKVELDDNLLEKTELPDMKKRDGVI